MRAEAYDAYIERKVREEAEARTIDTYERDLNAYFDCQKKLTAGASGLFRPILTKAGIGKAATVLERRFGRDLAD
jgi:hypothetical protein